MQKRHTVASAVILFDLSQKTVFLGKGTKRVTLIKSDFKEAKSVLLTVDIVYNGAATKDEYKSTETIAVSVQQRQRVKFGDPIVYDDLWVDQPGAVAVQMFNLGKSPLYNASVTVEGPGLAMEEAYFGGNIPSGGTMRPLFPCNPVHRYL